MIPNLREPNMIKFKLAAAVVVAALATTPVLAANWNGTANYGVEAVGPFNTYDFSSAGVLLLKPQDAINANGYYQSFVTQHLLDGLNVSNPLLAAGNYEITVVADFKSQLTSTNAFGQTFAVNSGSFSLWLDTTPDRNFNTDSGFKGGDGVKIMEGTVLSGAGSNVNFSGQQFGGGALQLQVTSYDHTIYNPNTIGGGDSIFTLRLNSPVDVPFLGPITSVQSNAYVAGTDLLYAADGNLILTAVPEPDSYAMLLAGLGLIGAIVRRRSAR
jgi:hypothetical protein